MSPNETLTKVPRCHTEKGRSVLQTSTASGNAVQSSHDKRLGGDATVASPGIVASSTHQTTQICGSLGAPVKRSRPKTPIHSIIPFNNIAAVAPLPLAQRDLKSLNARPVLRAADDDTINGLKPEGRVDDDNDDFHINQDHADLPCALQQHKPCQQHTWLELPADPDLAASRRPPGSSHRRYQQEHHRQLLLQELQDDKENEREQAAHWAAEVARLEAETDRILAEQRKRDLARRQRLELQLSAPLPPLPPPASSSLKEKLSLLAKGRRAQKSTLSLRSAASPSVSPSSSAGTSFDLRRIKSSEPGSMSRKFIEAGGRGPTDAPRGASNGADRRVTVRCKGLTLDLVVSVDTAAVDILIACSDQAPQPISVSTGILIESYGKLGLERRIRRYERVRDVMNSWDNDTQNTLVVSTDAVDGDPELELSGVPHTDKPPTGFILPIYHSHKHGKWSKRYVTLLENGQLVSSRKPEPAPSDKDVVSLCHLSDFDIYMPTESQKRKTLKPPKKHCFAIKSQQKMAVFLNNDNYVHYFSTEDNEVADDFRSRIQHWRSWYLVNRALQIHAKKKPIVKPEPKQPRREAEKPPQIPADEPSPPKKSVGHVRVNGHKVKVSVDEAPYAIGEFKPLINLQRFNKPLDEFGSDWEADPRTSTAAADHARGSLELRRELSGNPTRASGEYKREVGTSHRASGEFKRDQIVRPERGQAAFAENGLLGAAYDERKQVQREENRHAKTMHNSSSTDAFIPGPNLLNSCRTTSGNTSTTATSRPSLSSAEGPKVEPQSWFPSALEHSAKSRTNTTGRPETSSSSTTASHRQQPSSRHRMPAQPLVNLNPTFVEPPQWSRTGRGHGFRAPEGKPLVDFATGPAAMPGARQYDAPPAPLIRRQQSLRSSDSNGTSRGRRPTATSSSGGSVVGGRRGDGADLGPLPMLPPGVNRSGQGHGQGPLIARIGTGERESRGRSNTAATAPTTGGQQKIVPLLGGADWSSRRDPRGRSGTLL